MLKDFYSASCHKQASKQATRPLQRDAGKDGGVVFSEGISLAAAHSSGKNSSVRLEVEI